VTAQDISRLASAFEQFKRIPFPSPARDDELYEIYCDLADHDGWVAGIVDTFIDKRRVQHDPMDRKRLRERLERLVRSGDATRSKEASEYIDTCPRSSGWSRWFARRTTAEPDRVVRGRRGGSTRTLASRPVYLQPFSRGSGAAPLPGRRAREKVRNGRRSRSQPLRRRSYIRQRSRRTAPRSLRRLISAASPIEAASAAIISA
jgi:hypothetical protein